MKTLETRGKTFKNGLLALAVLATVPFGAFAQDDALIEDAQNVFNSDQIDIDGEYSQPRVSAADKIQKLRKKLEQQNEDMVQKKIEDIRIREEQKLATKLKNAFNGNLNADRVNTQSSAVAKVVAPVPEKEEKKSKIIPKFGITNYSGNGLELESQISLGLNIETELNSRFTIGLGVQYSSLDITDVSNQNKNYFNNYYNYDYNRGREMSYSQLIIELNSKVYLAVESKLRPYLGAGVGYNRSTLGYDDTEESVRDYNRNYNYRYNYNSNYYNSVKDVSSSYVTASATAGAEMSFSDSIGANLEFKYNKALTTTNSSTTKYISNPDQRKIESVSEDIQEADQFSVQGGLVVKF